MRTLRNLTAISLAPRPRAESRIADGVAGAALALLLAAAALLSPTASPLVGQSFSTHEAGALGADLRAEALERVELGDSHVDAADFLVDEARVLPMGDLERARTLQLAARLYWHESDLEGAHRTLTRAGLIAHRAGEATLAVRCFLDAAQAAAEEGDPEAAWTAGQRAGKVIHSTDFSAEERLRMLARVVYSDQPATLQTTEPLARQ